MTVFELTAILEREPGVGAGIDITVVSERLGHSTMAVTADLYTHVVPSHGRDAARRIGSSGTAARMQMPTSDASDEAGEEGDVASPQVDRAPSGTPNPEPAD